MYINQSHPMRLGPSPAMTNSGKVFCYHNMQHPPWYSLVSGVPLWCLSVAFFMTVASWGIVVRAKIADTFLHQWRWQRQCWPPCLALCCSTAPLQWMGMGTWRVIVDYGVPKLRLFVALFYLHDVLSFWTLSGRLPGGFIEGASLYVFPLFCSADSSNVSLLAAMVTLLIVKTMLLERVPAPTMVAWSSWCRWTSPSLLGMMIVGDFGYRWNTTQLAQAMWTSSAHHQFLSKLKAIYAGFFIMLFSWWRKIVHTHNYSSKDCKETCCPFVKGDKSVKGLLEEYNACQAIIFGNSGHLTLPDILDSSPLVKL